MDDALRTNGVIQLCLVTAAGQRYFAEAVAFETLDAAREAARQILTTNADNDLYLSVIELHQVIEVVRRPEP